MKFHKPLIKLKDLKVFHMFLYSKIHFFLHCSAENYFFISFIDLKNFLLLIVDDE